MEDTMINMPDSVFDDKIGNKRVRDGEDQEIHKGRLEKRPSGIFGANGGGDYTVDGGDEGGESGGINGGSGGGGGIIDTFISNVFQKNRSGDEDEAKTSVFDVVEDEDKRDDHLGVDGSGGDADGGGGGGGGGIIGSFFSNIFQHNGSVDEDGDQAKSGDLLHEVAEKTEGLGGAPGGGGEGGGGDGGGELVDVTTGKLMEKKDEVGDLASKDPTGHTLNLKPDEYSERVFFLNNN